MVLVVRDARERLCDNLMYFNAPQSKGDHPMIAKHLFIFKDGFNPDDQVVNGAKALETKYSPKAYSRSTVWIKSTE